MINIAILLDPSDRHRYPHDLDAIVRAMNFIGYNCTHDQANILWQKYSDSMCAGWMHVPKDPADVVDCIRPYFVEVV